MQEMPHRRYKCKKFQIGHLKFLTVWNLENVPELVKLITRKFLKNQQPYLR